MNLIAILYNEENKPERVFRRGQCLGSALHFSKGGDIRLFLVDDIDAFLLKERDKYDQKDLSAM